MRTNALGISLIVHFEGLRLKPYRCPAGVWTIGVGTTYIDGQAVSQKTLPISKQTAIELLHKDLVKFELSVMRLIIQPLSCNMFSALVSFCYNLGAGSLQCSTLRMKLNRGDYEGAANELLRWNKAGGRVLGGLIRRRQAERSLFLQD